jgi:Fe(3+) dicitrate transport protein
VQQSRILQEVAAVPVPRAGPAKSCTLAQCPVLAFPSRAATAFAQDAPADASLPNPPAEAELASARTAATPASTPRKDEIVEIRVIGNKADGLQRIPGSGTRIGEKELERAQPFDIGEILRRVPGVQVRQDYGGGNRIDISIRGLEAGRGRKVLILEDGMPISLNPYAESDLNFAPPVERMRGIEVVKGSGSILFGPQTVGGVINFVTIAPPSGTKFIVDAEGGQRLYARGLLNYGDTLGSVRYVTQVFRKRGDGFRGVGFEVTDAFGKLAFDTSPRGDLTLKLGYHTESTDSDAVGLTRQMFRDDPRRPKIALYDGMRVDFYQLGATHEQRFSKATKLTTLAYAYRTDRIWRRQDYDRFFTADETYDRIVGDPKFPSGAIYFKDADTILDRSYDVAGVEPRITHNFLTGRIVHTVDTGLRVLLESARYQQRTGTNKTSYAGSLDYEEHHKTFALAAYLQDRIAFREDLLVTPGIRFERAAFHRVIDRQRTGSGVSDSAVEGDTLATGVIPGIGIIGGGRNAHVFGGMHVGWSPPRITAAVSARGTPSLLDPERSINYEVGGRLNHKKWLRFEGAGFLSNFFNQVVNNTQAGSSGGEQVNGGPTRILGGEASMAIAVGSLVKSQTVIDVSTRYTYSRATFTVGENEGRRLPYSPLHSMNANLDIEHPSGFGGQVAYTFTSSQYTDVRNTIAVDTTGRAGILASRNIVDLTAHYAHKSSGLSFRLSVKNALDDIYVISRRPEGIFPAGYRQIVLGVRWVYEKSDGFSPP